MKFEKGYKAVIDERFSIHIARNNEEELKAIIKLNLEVHHEEVLEQFIHRVFLKHPLRDKILFLYIKDNIENKLASSICLAPLQWVIDGIDLPICEMEFVGTLEEYRGKGFIKILNELYENIMDQNDYILSVIRGIPYYYRSLGYEYVSTLDDRISIPLSKIPAIKHEDILIRKAQIDDLAFIESKYNEFSKNFYIFNKFDPECFTFKFLNEEFNSEIRSSYIFEINGVMSNYFSLGLSYDNQNYEILSPELDEREMQALLQFILKLGNFSNKDIVTLSINKNLPLFNYIISLGGSAVSSYGWQCKIPKIEKLLHLMKPLLEKRVYHSDFMNLTQTFRISDYQTTYEICFEKGELIDVDLKQEYPNPQTTELRIPGAFLFKLLLGDRTIDELNYILKDAIVHFYSRPLFETLFPKKSSILESYI